MTTVIRAKLSEKNKYYVDKHRYYELKHFCLQYPIWKREYTNLDGYSSTFIDGMPRSNDIGDPTSKYAEDKLGYLNKIKLIEQAAIDSDPDLSNYILKGVTEDLSYNLLHTKYRIPCGRNTYYDRYRKFFWILDKVKY